MTLTIISTFALLLLSAFFSAAEAAITTASRPLMSQLLGNTFVNILASALATSALIALFGDAGGRLLIRGTVPIRDLNREFGWRLPDAEAVTLAGTVVRVTPGGVDPLPPGP